MVHFRMTHVTMDDARVDGDVITVSSLGAGNVTELPVIEGDVVAQGQLLARIDAREILLRKEMLLARLRTLEAQMLVVKAQGGQVDGETLGKYQAEANRLVAAEASVSSARVQQQHAQAEYARARQLTEQKWLSPQALERAAADLHRFEEAHRKAVAELASARGDLASASGSRKQLDVIQRQLLVLGRQADEVRAEVQLLDKGIADRTISSPADGVVVMTFVRAGEHVSEGQRILMFHDPRKIWVEANVKETDVARLRQRLPARVSVDAYPGEVFEGRILRVGAAATAKFALLPNPNPSGNFTRVTQRMPVRIEIADASRRLRPGMLVEVDVDTRER